MPAGSQSADMLSITSTAPSSSFLAGLCFLADASSTSSGERTSSWNSIVVSDSTPSRTRTSARYSRARIAKRATAARSVWPITSASRR